MVYDSARQVTLLFGGIIAGGFKGDTWQWDGQDWTQLSDLGPSARFGHAMAFDSIRNWTVLFGGSINEDFATGHATGSQQDTWDGKEWVQLAEFGPSGRDNTAMTWTNHGVILFGGYNSQYALTGDTWKFDGKHWTQLQDIGPSARSGDAMAFDSARNCIVLFGGKFGECY
ncbi:MAG: kelch motif-containing protein [Methylobacter sp.]|uniref:kelch repeat-containing protein n=1 Tax=Methylobacter sp. TaxID=2051955 RepID=UPI0025FBE72D|nr:kelch repeat-containing protein [Methylobacter sp.]MCK9619125.1 kelch motif-containing protein [Methylobacter sp.]